MNDRHNTTSTTFDGRESPIDPNWPEKKTYDRFQNEEITENDDELPEYLKKYESDLKTREQFENKLRIERIKLKLNISKEIATNLDKNPEKVKKNLRKLNAIGDPNQVTPETQSSGSNRSERSHRSNRRRGRIDFSR